MNISEPDDVQPINYSVWARCADRFPIEGSKYYLMLGCRNRVISYYSRGAAWDGSNEVRVARLVRALDAVLFYRRKNITCLVIENFEDMHRWYAEWGGHALVAKQVWDEFTAD